MIRVPMPQLIAGALAVFFGAFVLWASIGDDPFGGQPMAVAPVHLQAAGQTKASGPPGDHRTAAAAPGPGHYDGPAEAAGPAGKQPGKHPPGTTTVNIINGMTGARQEVTVPAPAGQSGSPEIAPVEQKFLEMTPLGPLPKIAANGVRPSEAFAQPVGALPGKPDAPRVAIIIGGLGVSARDTASAIANLPGSVTLGFVPYGNDGALVAQARNRGHEVLLQVPMEPFDYPNNDPGPETLLTSLAPQQNIERLHWAMSRFEGYVGLMNLMGARFTSSEQALSPILRESGRRGLIFVDDGSNPRSAAGRIAGANNLLFAKAEVTIDAVATPDEIDRALGRLEAAARERHVAVGIASALPVSIAHIANWAKSAAKRGILLVPITAAAAREKQS